MTDKIEDLLTHDICHHENGRNILLTALKECAEQETVEVIYDHPGEDAALVILRHIATELREYAEEVIARGPREREVEAILIATRFATVISTALDIITASKEGKADD